MILITGGLGFVGSNTAEALAKLDESCLLVQRSDHEIPAFLQPYIGSRIIIDHGDVTDLASLQALGKKYDINGIIHLAASSAQGAFGLPDDIRSNMTGLANVLQMAHEWQVKRTLVASTLGVYGGVSTIPWREDQPLPLTAASAVPAYKKATEVFVSCAANSGLDCVTVRLAGMYGPGCPPAKRVLAVRMVHAALAGQQPDTAGIFGSTHAADGYDQCYIKDIARALALLQTAPQLSHQVYNVASGRPTTNQDVAEAIKKCIPNAVIELPSGHAPGMPEEVGFQDISWLREDTGYEPSFSTDSAVKDYINWLQAGNKA